MAQTNTRYISLDLLRGIAAVGVVVYHSMHYSIQLFSPLYVLVDLFFVLSGFVLLPIFPSQQNDKTAIKSFILKRALRFWPMTVAALLFLAIVLYQQVRSGNVTFEKYGSQPVVSFIGALLLLQIFSAASTMWIVPLWSLSAEWFSNLVAIPVLLRKSIKLDFLCIAFGILLTAVGFSVDADYISNFGPTKGLEAFGRALTGLFVGIVVRKSFHKLGNVYIFKSWFFAIASSATLYLLIYFYGDPLVIVAPFLLAPIIVRVALANESLSASKLSGFAVKIGGLSFGIYVWHSIFVDLFGAMIAKSGRDFFTDIFASIIVFVLALMVSIFATLCTQRFIEKPINNRVRLRQKQIESR